MSYLNQTQDPGRRVAGVAVTAAVHAVLGIGVITGLAMVGIKVTEAPPMQPIDFTPRPEATPTPTPVEPTTETSSTIVTPKPDFDLPTSSTAEAEIFDPYRAFRRRRVYDRRRRTRGPAPSSAAARLPPETRRTDQQSGQLDQHRRLSGLGVAQGIEGLARYRVIVGSNGRVSSCEITATSGDALLDSTACKLITRRARFDAATDGTGASVVGSYSGSVHWEIPD